MNACLCSASFQLQEFLAPLVKELAVSGSHSFSVLSGFHEPCFDAAGRKGTEAMLGCLVSPRCCYNRFSFSLAGFEVKPKASMAWRLWRIPVSRAVPETPFTDSFSVASSVPLLPVGTLSPCLPPFPVGSYVAALEPLTTLRSMLKPHSPGSFLAC